jgi:sugar phosphate isomerase/epimerase
VSNWPRLAVSNIAWEPHEDDLVAAVLRDEQVAAIEIAPTKWRERPYDASASEIDAYRQTWADRGLRIASLQALLFGRPDLQLFGDTRAAMREHLARAIDFAAAVGATALVFGSPKNRLRGTLPADEAGKIAIDFFRDLGAHAVERGAVVCIEANPPEYGGDFITTTAEAIALCAAIDHPGVAINGDLGGMTMSGDNPWPTIASAGHMLGHFHVSEPHLAEPGAAADHASAAAGLAGIGYKRWISIEMRAAGDNVERVRRAVRFAKEKYATVGAPKGRSS